MADDKKGFLLYADYIHVIRKMPLEKAGELFLTILSYVNDENPVVNDMLVDLVFEPIKQQLKRDLIKYQDTKTSKSESGVLGNLKRWNNDLYQKVISEEMRLNEAVTIAKGRKESHSDVNPSQRIANIAVNVNDSVNVNDNVNDIIREGNSCTIPPHPSDSLVIKKEKRKNTRVPAPELPETVKDVENYMFNKMKNRWDAGFTNLQAHKFFNHYQANGWKQSKGNKIQNWHSAANMWIYRDIEKQGPMVHATPSPVAKAKPTEIVQPSVPLSPAQKETQLLDFTESIYTEFMEGTVKEDGLPANIYTLLKDKGMLMLSDQERERIQQQANGDKVKAKKKAIAEYFTSLIVAGHRCVFDNVDA